jgi:hypothetical protein
MSPRITACVPWYRPHSSAADVAMMMKATSTERARAPHGGVEGIGGRLVETRRLACFGGVALHHGNRVEHLGGDGAGVGHAVLAGARQLAHAPAEPHRRRDDQHQHAQHLHHEVGVGVDQHAQRAHAHHGIAQAHAQRGAHDGLHQRRVAGQARQHFAGLRGLEKLRALPHHMRRPRCAGRPSRARPASSPYRSGPPKTAPAPRPRQTARRSGAQAISCWPLSAALSPPSIRLRKASGNTSVATAASTRKTAASRMWPQ